MSCYHPLMLRHRMDKRSGVLMFTKDNKPDYEILSVPPDFDDDSPVLKIVPCGRCIGCRLDYSRHWADRLMMELQYHDSAYFITLTYDDQHVPISTVCDDETGEWSGGLTLSKRDYQLFLKRLRFLCSDDIIRYYLAGEYGPNTFRPHYHAIIFGLHLHDLVRFSKSALGYQYYTSEFLTSVWGLGHVLVGEVSWDTCAYTARYVTKKLTGDLADAAYGQFGLQPPFSSMSTHPHGLGWRYVQDHPEIVRDGKSFISTPDGSKTLRSSRYLQRLFEIDFPDEAEQLRVVREHMAKQHLKAIRLQTDVATYAEYLAICEEHKIKSIKSLKRRDF